jgi:hypothetical protein
MPDRPGHHPAEDGGDWYEGDDRDLVQTAEPVPNKS